MIFEKKFVYIPLSGQSGSRNLYSVHPPTLVEEIVQSQKKRI